MDLKGLLKQEEGVRHKPYVCPAGKLTIAVGRNLEAVGLSDDEIEYLLDNDIKRVTADLDRALPWWRALSEARQIILQSMCFQLGINGLLMFKRFLAAAQRQDWDEAYAQMLDSKWAREDSPERARRHALVFLDRES